MAFSTKNLTVYNVKANINKFLKFLPQCSLLNFHEVMLGIRSAVSNAIIATKLFLKYHLENL